ncbi:coiled-coil domain-containing protein 166 isoform X3 [Oncorhynchus tshawytscha]|uniref:DUF4515 domain-containing protein n=1 Tax=Oncorhynchus tshawytscha TaxID=74940 RepID=A0AAZ3QSC4_ONCTS|nr:coiled-coil domain-containing protein 166 isoform X3 [Oncorhynchus tshawytscha]
MWHLAIKTNAVQAVCFCLKEQTLMKPHNEHYSWKLSAQDLLFRRSGRWRPSPGRFPKLSLCTLQQEYMSYMSKRTQKRQSAIVTLSDQNHQAQENLKRQREENLDKYQEQANELKKEILEKENELALLNIEIAELREFKSLQQQQLGRIAELEREVTSMHCRHSESLQALKAGFLSEKERYEAQAKQKIQALALAANREASRCLLSHTRAVSLENQHLREELQQLIQRAHSLRGLQDQLQAQRQQLLLEREYVRELRRLRATPGPTPPGSHTRPLGVDRGREDTRHHRTADT